MDDTTIDPLPLLAWFTAFLSPSLEEISIAHGQSPVPDFPKSPAVLLIKSISMAIPIPDNITLSSHYDFPSKIELSLLCPSEYHERYYSFTHLPNLMGLRNLFMRDRGFLLRIGEGLSVLAHLPCLESLGIQCGVKPIVMETPSFPLEAFPRLRYLRLGFSFQVFQCIWSLHTIVSKLTTVNIRLIDKSAQNKFRTDLIPILAERSSGAQNLIIARRRGPMYKESDPIEVELVFELLSRLPLRSVEFLLYGIKISEGSCFDYQESSFPTLYYLKLADSIKQSHLRIIAKAFPNLKYLDLAYSDPDLESSDEISHELGLHAAHQPIKANVTFKFRHPLEEIKRRNTEVNLTHVLGSLWPNASHIEVESRCRTKAEYHITAILS